MSNSIITVTNVSKRYTIGHKVSDDGVRHIVESAIRNPAKWLRERRERRKQQREEFWALRDITFSIDQGDVVGIIGRNGAGKSTLLKVLSRITEPTTGRIELGGRVASLLEVGTGFHGDLSGRENIFLNGAILGMTKEEIKRKFDEIVTFAELDRFLDTPVKRYSSGMFVRLAFAVAAHLEPEILIVDEVLAVGDMTFQKKCLGKMNEVARGGRTVLFVSHNMAVVRQLCNKGILLKQGKVLTTGTVDEVADAYLADGIEHEGYWRRDKPLPDKQGIFIEECSVLNSEGQVAGRLDCRESFSVQIKGFATDRFNKGQIALSIINKEGVVILTTCNSDMAREYRPIESGRHTWRVEIPGNLLSPDVYYLRVIMHQPGLQHYDGIDSTVSFNVDDAGSLRAVFHDNRSGLIEPILPWSNQREK